MCSVIIVSLGRLITVLKTSQEVNSDPTCKSNLDLSSVFITKS